MADTDRLVAIGEAAHELGISIPQLRRLAIAGRVPYQRTDGGHRRFDVEQVRRAIGLAAPSLSSPRSAIPATAPAFEETLRLQGLEESAVWRRATGALGLIQGSPESSVFHYAFTEVLNNSIDHSSGQSVTCRAWRDGGVWFQITDDGVGAFARLEMDLGLPSLQEAALQLTKGKGTSDPSRHSGQGLFFTSKVVDQLRLDANGLAWIVDNGRGDQALGRSVVANGTTVSGRFALPPKRTTTEVFERFTDGNLRFSRTMPSVRLAQLGSEFVSRSEAKRVMSRLEDFDSIELDFAGVDAVGQAFVDEVFRVWAKLHPDVRIAPTHMNEEVRFMVERGLRSAESA